MKKEDDFLEKAEITEPKQPVPSSLDLSEVSFSASKIDLEEEVEVDFDTPSDPAFVKEPKPFLTLTGDRNKDALSSYLRTIQKFPMLGADEEYQLAKQWQEHHDKVSKEKIIGSHLRLVSKIAQGYRGYGMPLLDLISEGHIGMMKALEKFDPDNGARFSTYAMWWVKAAMKDYVMRNWSLVKTGTTAAQKKLFFNLRTKRNTLLDEGQRYLTKAQISEIATDLNVPEKTVAEMARRLRGNDYSLNTPLKGETEGQWQDWIEDDTDNHAETIAHKDELNKRLEMVNKAFQHLKPRELQIIQRRRLMDPPKTLEEVGIELNISRERVRQIEIKAFLKVQNNVKQQVYDTQHITIKKGP